MDGTRDVSGRMAAAPGLHIREVEAAVEHHRRIGFDASAAASSPACISGRVFIAESPSKATV